MVPRVPEHFACDAAHACLGGLSVSGRAITSGQHHHSPVKPSAAWPLPRPRRLSVWDRHARAWLEQAPALAEAYLQRAPLNNLGACNNMFIAGAGWDSPAAAAAPALASELSAMAGWYVRFVGAWPPGSWQPLIIWRLLYLVDAAVDEPTTCSLSRAEVMWLQATGCAAEQGGVRCRAARARWRQGGGGSNNAAAACTAAAVLRPQRRRTGPAYGCKPGCAPRHTATPLHTSCSPPGRPS